MNDHQHIPGGIDEDGTALRVHLSRDHGVKPWTLPDPATWHRSAHAMTDNHQRADELLPAALHLYYPDVLDAVAAALDEAEARGRAEVAAKVEALANELERDARTDIQTVRWITAEIRRVVTTALAESEDPSVGEARRPCPEGCPGGHTESEYYSGDCRGRDQEAFEGWGPGR